MSVTHLPMWDVTAVEIALDLEPPRPSDSSRFAFSGPWEPRICLAAAFALTSQLKRIVSAVDRVIPGRLPSKLQIAPAKARNGRKAPLGVTAIAPMLPLLRLQNRLIRAVEPGLADYGAGGSLTRAIDMDADAADFVRDFISNKMLPMFEPTLAMVEFTPMRLQAIGITLYRLDRQGTPQSILGHWPYVRSPRGSVHLRSGP